MIDCISVENMRQSDAWTIANLVPSLELMGRAAEGVYRVVKWHGKVAIVVGSGNNGGDGFALACIMKRQGMDCEIFTLSNRLSADSAYYAENAKNLNVPIRPYMPGCLEGFDMAVDCLLGTGFAGGVRENYRAAIEGINESGAEVISVDINSGMNGDTGEAEIAVRSDLTVTIGYVKNGLVTQNAGRYMKRLRCTDIGIKLACVENKILAPGEAGEGIVCPDWLDMNIIRIEEAVL